jgi:hypothetical protein
MSSSGYFGVDGEHPVELLAGDRRERHGRVDRDVVDQDVEARTDRRQQRVDAGHVLMVRAHRDAAGLAGQFGGGRRAFLVAEQWLGAVTFP